jgi:hypothetical protein
MELAGRPAVLALTAALLSAAACSSDSTGPRGSLTNDELAALALQMGTHFAGSFSGSAASFSKGEASFSAIPAPFSFTVNVSVPCPRGGKTDVAAQVSGVIDHAAQSVKADASGTHTPKECGFDVDGKTIWVSGELETAAHVEVVNGVPKGEQSASLRTPGEPISWRTSDGRSGSCAINYTAKANYDTNRAVVNGSFCGSTVSFDGPLTTN